ncbi:uncharacterized protein LOC125946771 [Dermacentor silvarum]|uniref:uncharacterized protein LOC125946771 n=1 Tax=Dermacentor silvarum TaxID=543639 RepID=UPI002101CD66|nr:uncharacterized protein LOC125946771 [Dermacentor silvarum]
MSSQQSKKSCGSEKTDNHHRHRESCKASDQMHNSSTDVLPPKATTTSSGERSGVTTCDPGNALKADATQMVADDCPEVGTASAGVPHLENRAGNVVGLWSTDVHLAKPHSSAETDFPRLEPTPSQPPPTTTADAASASHRVSNGNAAGGQLNAEAIGDQGSQSTDARSRQRLILRRAVTTTPVQETVSPWKKGCHQGNSTNSQEAGGSLSAQRHASVKHVVS